MMYICRVSGFVSGKTYNNACHYSAAGQENVITIRYEVLLSDVESEWRSFDEVKRSEIKKHAIAAGTDSNTKDSLYICLGTCLMAGIPGTVGLQKQLRANCTRIYVNIRSPAERL